MRRRPAIILVLLALIAGCALVSQSLFVGPTKSELCRALGRDPGTDPQCKYTDGVLQLLEASFPVGRATRGQVRSALGQYFIDSYPRAIGGFDESYVVQKTILTPVQAIFSFDKNDILVSIVIED